jgi:uncharacterized membrane protein YhiD involved in acid resistance
MKHHLPDGPATASDFFTSALNFDITSRHVAEILVHLGVALTLGAVLAYRPWRRFLKRTFGPPAETAQAQMIIAVAGAMMVAVIGDSLARAFGLVGLGAFIRFRSGIKDPRDVAVMFVMIGIGMACGLGLIPTALIATVFVGGLLVFLDATGRQPPRKVRVGVDSDQPAQAFAALRAGWPGAKALEMPSSAAGAGKVVAELEAATDTDAASVLKTLEDAKVPGVRGVTVEED